MSNALVPISDIERMSVAVAKSGLFGIKSPDQAMALMLIAQAEGLHPAIAARDYHIIQGRPALKADAMLARFQSAGGRVKWIEMSDRRVAAEFSHPQGGTVEIDWTPERARQAGISNDMHKKYPRQMLRARVISEGIRTVFPGVVVGTYTPEEIAEFEPERAPRPMRDVTPEPEPEYQDMDWCDAVVDAMLKAPTLQALKTTFDTGVKMARQNSDSEALARITAAKDLRKEKLTAPAPAAVTVDSETGEVI